MWNLLPQSFWLKRSRLDCRCSCDSWAPRVQLEGRQRLLLGATCAAGGSEFVKGHLVQPNSGGTVSFARIVCRRSSRRRSASHRGQRAPRPAHGPLQVAWTALDAVDVTVELRCPVPTLQDVPPFMRSAGVGYCAEPHTRPQLWAHRERCCPHVRAWNTSSLPRTSRAWARRTVVSHCGVPARMGVVAGLGAPFCHNHAQRGPR